jgi:plastocyanin
MSKLRSIPTLALLAVLAGCEGEPPKTPGTTVVGGGPTPTAEAPAEPDESAQAAPAAPDAGTAPTGAACGCCPCATGDGGVAEGGVAVTAAPPVVATTTSSTLSGTLTMAGKPLPFGVVYLEDAPVEPNAKMTARIDNRQMAFVPFLTVIPAGGKVTFANGDPFPHNVFSPDADKFNMGTISQNQVLVHAFPKAGTYSLLCNLHPGMLGYVVVAPSSYFAKTDAKGHYAIKGVPPGTHKVTAWSPRLPTDTKSVDVKGGDATLDFELHR